MGNSVTVLFRADIAEYIRTSRIMLCLTLAKLLFERGVSIIFISQLHKEHCLDKERGAGFKVIELFVDEPAKYEGVGALMLVG